MTLFPVASPNGLKRRRGRRASNDVAAYHTLTAALKAFSFIPLPVLSMPGCCMQSLRLDL